MRLFKFFIFITLINLFISEQLKSAIPFEDNSLKIKKLPKQIRFENYGFTLDKETPHSLNEIYTLKKRQGSFVVIELFEIQDRTHDLILNEIQINFNHLLFFPNSIDLKFSNLHIPEDFIRSNDQDICYSKLRGIDKNNNLIFQKIYIIKLKNSDSYEKIDKNFALFMKSIKDTPYPPLDFFSIHSKL